VRKRTAEVLASLCASFPKRAVIDALLDVKTLSKSELERLVDKLKAAPQQPPRPKQPRVKADGSPAARIKRVLTAEAGLSPDQAMSQLRAELARTTRASLPPAVGSLESWLKAVLEALPAGEVLNAAMTIAGRVRP
jgi:hypothetical protein